MLGGGGDDRSETFEFRTSLYKLREEREITPKAFTHMVSSLQYSKRFGPYFVEPVFAGLGGAKGDEPFIASNDVIGCINWAKDFVVAGTASDSLFGICESFFEPNMVLDAWLFNWVLMFSVARWLLGA